MEQPRVCDGGYFHFEGLIMATSSTASLSETAIANMAVSVLDETFLTNIYSETGMVARFMAANFGFARDELLRGYPWSFAKDIDLLAPYVGAKKHPAWQYAYQLPGNCLRLLPLRYGNSHEGTLIPYEKIGRVIYTNENYGGGLPITYIHRETNAAVFDPLFARALGYYLALLAAHGITGKQSYVQKAQDLYQQAIQTAFHVDSLERGTQERYDDETSDVLTARLAGV